MMWAISRVRKPMSKPKSNHRLALSAQAVVFSQPEKSASACPANTNSSIMDTPVMMSALVMGMLLTVRHAFRGRRFMLEKPMAAAVPATVAMAVARTDTSSVVCRASSTVRLFSSCTYQSRVKPPQTALDLESLKEKTMRTKMGAYKKRNIKNRNPLESTVFFFTAAPPLPHPRRSGS